MNASHFSTAATGGYFGALERSKLSKIKHQEYSYNDILGDRSTTNRTPLLEHY